MCFMHAVKPYATEFDNDGKQSPQSVEFGFSEHAIEFANNGIQWGYFLIFSKASMRTRRIPVGKQPAEVVQRLRHGCCQRTKFIR
jgi:hypothetical protein